jgi:hypothetical protein
MKAKKHCQNIFPDGPATLNGALLLPVEYGRLLTQGKHTGFRRVLRRRRLVVCSSFSGTGSFECTIDRLFNAGDDGSSSSSSEVGPCQGVTYYSATEISPKARAALLSHSHTTQPLHIFGDILERLPKNALADLKELETYYLGLWRHLKSECALGEGTRRDLVVQGALWGREFVTKVLDVLRTVDFEQTVWCFKHMKRCPFSPRHPESEAFA